ncbi:hypothetical protein GCM10017786_01080 [Amycolatopsis deserti]|uniref:Uncharacterized protein n=1 Tax=Amycolatopsis deserti TaxID=185696 RepID=A0ABQ3IDX8_9PSEU|nr:hypothetical protein GCM10017786_01080 [Amycolatopsis deserti]
MVKTTSNAITTMLGAATPEGNRPSGSRRARRTAAAFLSFVPTLFRIPKMMCFGGLTSGTVTTKIEGVTSPVTRTSVTRVTLASR